MKISKTDTDDISNRYLFCMVALSTGYDLLAPFLVYFICRSFSVRLYNRKVSSETITPLRRLNGTTAKNTRVDTFVIFAFTDVPMAMIASSGIPYSFAKVGNR